MPDAKPVHRQGVLEFAKQGGMSRSMLN
jgi:hypothetical protein